ncbi:ethanolamine utilization protein EutG [Virgibacillus indicus]|uniref:Ethanolamine utilization protein EutG n=1 Tax=Virgibacillus indicus TaxID=2024554 RepID=A0A265N7P6_9BACI|nr:ABC transporter substrate-binding protein [Virgibacillus indicus]OZU88032.1 ethanolamine utilization protein EutG [Virgibacillus indicus]
MKKFYSFLVVAFLAVVLIGCSSDSDADSAQGESGDKETETFKVGYMPNYASMNSVVAGIETGSFEEQGLEVELVEFADGPTIIAALESGSIDAGYIGPGAHVLPIQGQAKIFAFSHLGNADEVIGNTEMGIESIEDLKGKKIGVATGTSSETILDLTLQEAGISEDDVTLVDMDASAIVTAMISGGVDAVATWSPNTNTIKEEMGDKAVMLTNNARYADVFPSIASWVVSPSYAEENAETIEKFTRGLYEGMDYHVENPEEVAKWVAKQSAVEEDAVLAQTGDGDWKKSEEILEMLNDGTIEQYYEKQQENFIESERLTEDDKVDVSEYLMLENMEKAAE